jgi:hypothetical protein
MAMTMTMTIALAVAVAVAVALLSHKPLQVHWPLMELFKFKNIA